MSRTAKVLIGFGIVIGLVCIGACTGLMWLFTPPQLQVPPRRYPPGNAYEPLRRIGIAIQQQRQHDAYFEQLTKKIGRQPPSLTPAERQAYLQIMEPYLKAYPRHLDQPCVAIWEYDPRITFPELIGFRELARAESLLMGENLARGRDKQAVERLRRVLTLGNQIRNDGGTIHYLVGIAMTTIALRPFFESPNALDEPTALKQMVETVRRWEQQRPSPSVPIQNERYFLRATMKALAEGNLQWSELTTTSSDPSSTRDDIPSWFLRPFVRLAVPEVEAWADAAVAESRKPAWQRSDKEPFEPRHMLSAILIPALVPFLQREAVELAQIRLMGCVAAIRLYKSRTGRYPDQLSALNLGEMAIDPFSGKPFVYKVDPQRGFLIYSLGVNRRDDGGRFDYFRPSSPRGDLLPLHRPIPEGFRNKPWGQIPLASPVWLK